MRIEIGAIIAALESKARNSDPLLWVGGAPTGQPAVFDAGSLPQGCRRICKTSSPADSRLAPNVIAKLNRSKE
jgi:hypothetical protein